MKEALVLTLSRLEAELHRPTVRTNLAHLTAVLHSDFEEVGRSGEFYSFETVIDALVNDKSTDEIIADGYVARVLGPDVVLLTYRSAHSLADGTLTRHTLRSSIWMSVDGRWQLRYHQGTPTTKIW